MNFSRNFVENSLRNFYRNFPSIFFRKLLQTFSSDSVKVVSIEIFQEIIAEVLCRYSPKNFSKISSTNYFKKNFCVQKSPEEYFGNFVLESLGNFRKSLEEHLKMQFLKNFLRIPSEISEKKNNGRTVKDISC